MINTLLKTIVIIEESSKNIQKYPSSTRLSFENRIHAFSRMNSTDFIEGIENRSYESAYTGSTSTFYVSVFLIWVPGTLSNLLAFGFIIQDMKKAMFPALFLLFVLCFCDLSAVLLSWIYHIILRYVEVSYAICASTAFTYTFFNISASVTNGIMSVDRVLAICFPFFYKKNIDVKTWIRFCSVSAVMIACYSFFPFAGLGDVMSRRRNALYCDSLSFQTEPLKRVYGVMFGILGVCCVSTILVGNSMIVKTLVRLNRRVTRLETLSSSTESSSGSSTSARAAPFEIAFAKLMTSLAAAYVLCGAPMQVYLMFSSVYNILDIVESFFFSDGYF